MIPLALLIGAGVVVLFVCASALWALGVAERHFRHSMHSAYRQGFGDGQLCCPACTQRSREMEDG